VGLPTVAEIQPPVILTNMQLLLTNSFILLEDFSYFTQTMAPTEL